MLSLYGEVYFRAWRVASGPYLKVVFFSAFYETFGCGQRVAKIPPFSPILLLWTDFQLIIIISVRMAKNEFCNKKL